MVCFSCFISADSVPEHTAAHFVTIDLSAFPSMALAKNDGEKTGWTFDEDVTLLELVQKFGFGNWLDCSAALQRSEKSCEDRLHKYFIPLTKNSNEITIKPGKFFEGINQKLLETLPTKLLDKKQEFGFIPLRQEFATEPFNDAELLLADCRLEDEDFFKIFSSLTCSQPSNIEKRKEFEENVLKIVQLFNQIVKTREEIKKFVLSVNFIWDKKRRSGGKIKYDTKEMFKPFARFLDDPNDFEDFVKCFDTIQDLKTKTESFSDTKDETLFSPLEVPAGEQIDKNDQKILMEYFKCDQKTLTEIEVKIKSLIMNLGNEVETLMEEKDVFGEGFQKSELMTELDNLLITKNFQFVIEKYEDKINVKII